MENFVIPNDSSLPAPLYNAKKRAFLLISRLKQLTWDSPLQQARIDSLNFYVHKRLDLSLKMVELRCKRAFTPAIFYASVQQIKTNIEVNGIVKTLCSKMGTEQNNHNVQFKIDVLHSTEGDSSAIKQGWTNVISNAVKYSRLNENAMIEIGCHVNGKEICYLLKIMV